VSAPSQESAISASPAGEDARSSFADAATHAELRLFLDREAELIDTRRYREWLAIVSDDFRYTMPVPLTPDNPTKPHYDPHVYIIDETKETLGGHWFRRFEPDMWEIAWSENPPVRYRHFVSNVRVRTTGEDAVFDVRSNVLISATRQSDQPTLLTAERFDVIRRGEGDWCLERRQVILDVVVVEFAHMRVVF
jgi:3-phenylpropionate/cinnamic acid dioxygenase small subunit